MSTSDLMIPINGGITEGGLIILGVLGVVLTFLVFLIRSGVKLRTSVAAVQNEVKNHHPENLRDDLDRKFGRVFDTLEAQREAMLQLNAGLTTMGQDLTAIRGRIDNQERRVTRMERRAR